LGALADQLQQSPQRNSSNETWVLVVDDESALVDLLCALLEELGYRTHAAFCGTHALEALAAQRFHVVVTDLMMPDVGGIDILRRSKARREPTEVVVLTGADDVDTAVACMKAGAFDFITKPFRLEAVAAVVRSAAAKVRAEEENRQLRDSIWASKQALMAALGARDSYTLSHCVSVAEIAGSFCEYLGLADDVRNAITLVGELHDVGKIGVADFILNKPGALTDAEFSAMKRHPVIGKDIIDPIGVFGVEGELVYYHHERWDGAGYPEGLSGESIPLVARLMAVVDCYDALTSDRPYREAFSEEAALGVVRRGAGTHFDPWLTHAFLGFVDGAELLPELPQVLPHAEESQSVLATAGGV